MRHFLTSLMAAAFVVGLALGLGQAKAAPLPTLNGLTSQNSPVEKVGYRYRGYGGYYPRYNYYRPYYRPYYYNYGYRPYYRNYGYRRYNNYRRYW